MDAAQASARWLAHQLSYAQQTLEGLPLPLQLLIIVVLVASVYQWQSRRRR